MPTTETAGSDSPAVGDRIRVTAVGYPEDEPRLYVGATGTVTDVLRSAVTVRWDDAELENDGIALIRTGSNPDRWEVTTDG